MRMRSLKSIIFQIKSKSQVTAPDDKQVAILKNGLQILMCKVLILAMILLKKLQMTPQVKTTKHVQKSDFIFQETFTCEVCNHKHDVKIYLRKHMESKLMTTTSKAVNAAKAPDINKVNAAGAVDINEVKIAESAEEKLPEC